MTLDTILSLEWVITRLAAPAASEPKVNEHRNNLIDLYNNMRMEYFRFNDEKRSMLEFMEKHNITIPQREFDGWRVVKASMRVMGHVNGLEASSYGELRATNGILCYIEQKDENNVSTMFLGHLGHFVKDEVTEDEDSEAAQEATEAAHERAHRNNVVKSIMNDIRLTPEKRAAAVKAVIDAPRGVFVRRDKSGSAALTKPKSPKPAYDPNEDDGIVV